MPCNSDYLAQTPQEEATQIVAKHLIYVKEKLGQETEPQLERDAKGYYPDIKNLDTYVVRLCGILKGLQTGDKKLKALFEEIVYNARSHRSRQLAEWWEEHEAADRARIAKEELAEKDKQDFEKVLDKLSIADKLVLQRHGLKVK